MVHEGRNGHLLPARDRAAFAAAVLRYRESPERLAAASREAREHTLSRFAWPVVADRLVSILREAAPRPRGARASLSRVGQES